MGLFLWIVLSPSSLDRAVSKSEFWAWLFGSEYLVADNLIGYCDWAICHFAIYCFLRLQTAYHFELHLGYLLLAVRGLSI